MKNLLKLSFYFSIALMVGLTSCGDDDDDDDNCGDASPTLEAEAENLGQALSNYISDDSSANCQAFLDAFDDYVDVIQDFRPCLNSTEQEELDEALDQFEASKDLITC